MKTKSLCKILEIPYTDHYYELVICVNPNLSYKNAKELLKHHDFYTKESSLEITRTDRHGIKTTIRFKSENNLEELRGCRFRVCYVEETLMNKLEKDLKTIYGPSIDKLMVLE